MALMKPAVIPEFFARLKKAMPEPKTELEYDSVYQLLVAVVCHERDRKHQKQWRENQGQSPDRCVSLANICAHQSPLQNKRQGHGNQQGAHANRGKRKTKELYHGGSKVKLPT